MTIDHIFSKQRDYFLTGKTQSYKARRLLLIKLKEMLKENESKIYLALKKDLNKSKHETLTTELGLLYSEIDFSLKHLKQWMKTESVDAPITHQGTNNYIISEPRGNVLIISTWNYPIQLALAPVIGAFSAGNTVILKPSELAKATETLLFDLINKYYNPEVFAVIIGDKKVSNYLVGLRFDYIFFTGSTLVGKSIMKKASDNLTPLTLELGGKSPVIVNKDANIKLAAKRIVWGKFTNAGQTCVAPDYLYVHSSIKKKLIKEMISNIKKLYSTRPLNNKDYVRIINERHFQRLLNLIDEDKIVHGGRYNYESLTIEPTIIGDISWQDSIMKDEIFGPLLPLLSFENINDVIDKINMYEKPLALYYFGKDENIETQILKSIRFGGGAINDTLYHLANPHLPFGGVGHSGMGSYHGKYSFKTFSHEKSIMEQTTKYDLPFRYPGSKITGKIVKYILK